ncbi:hypothetical protein TL16_g09329 [Triparma laevis f. inornata]|uniref:Rho termination factor-like N-terminal domain-containing protein n=1 Tax=Triparma laevis f. inornata TaxID=1714386 RepID=A0A9W7B9B2_9STRA|nr:hypothetical protein TL16_g09329 [Triparma laevis f. inornata]
MSFVEMADYTKLTVPEFKALCETRDIELPKKSKKADIVALLENNAADIVASLKKNAQASDLEKIQRLEMADYPKLTVPELKELCLTRDIELPKKSKKADIVALLEKNAADIVALLKKNVQASDLEKIQQAAIRGLRDSYPPPIDDFRHTNDYRRYLVNYIDRVSMMSLRVVDKAWQVVVDQRIDALVKGGSLMVHGGNDISNDKADTLIERRKGIESISHSAFASCTSLINVTFPKSLESIGQGAFYKCKHIEFMDLSHTLLSSIGERAFSNCYKLKSLKLPSSAQSAGEYAFYRCRKLVPKNGYKFPNPNHADTTNMVRWLHSTQYAEDPRYHSSEKVPQYHYLGFLIEDSENSDIDSDEGDY